MCADEICSLAATATTTISDAIGRLQEIGDRARRLRDDTNQALEQRSEKHAALDEDLHTSLADLAELHEAVTQAREDVGVKARELSRAINSTLDDIRFDRKMVGHIEEVTAELADTCDLLQSTVQPSSGVMDLDEVASRYTMEDELRIHRTVLGGTDGEEADDAADAGGSSCG